MTLAIQFRGRDSMMSSSLRLAFRTYLAAAALKVRQTRITSGQGSEDWQRYFMLGLRKVEVVLWESMLGMFGHKSQQSVSYGNVKVGL